MTAQSDRHVAPASEEPSAEIPAIRRARETRTVPIGSLSPADSPRLAGEDDEHARMLAESETPLPPILVHRSTMRVIDGMHRLRAASLRGHDEIEVEFFDGTDAAAFVLAVQANTTHGLPLSMKDRKAAALRILHTRPEMSDRSVAEAAGLSAKTVGTIRKNAVADLPPATMRLGKDGRLRPVATGAGRQRIAEALAADPHASLREIAQRAAVSQSTVHAVKTRLGTRTSVRPPQVERTGRPSPPPRPSRLAPPAGPAKDGLDRLDSLRRDPSIRLSDTGRDLLRWFSLHADARRRHWNVIQAVPPHVNPIVVDMALQCAEFWAEFAEALQERQSGDDVTGRVTEGPIGRR
jgi:ParB-like chromosome segregation protein Spo0J